MIMVQSNFHLLPEFKAEALELIKKMIRLCREENGCLSYEFFEGLSDSNQLILLQEWEDADRLQLHYKTAHMEEFIIGLGNYLEKPITTRSYVSPETRPQSVKSKRASEQTATPEQTIH